MAKIGVYGGAFNPPHKGHHLLAKQAVAKLSLDKLIIIPSLISPHKKTDTVTPAQDRLAMCRLAFEDIENAEVSDMELRRGGVSYTSDTLKILKGQYPGDELMFLMGDDMFLSFDTWNEPEVISALATLTVFLRDRSKGNEVLEKAIDLKLKYNAKTAFVKNVVYEAASSEIRADFEDMSSKLQNSVSKYIVERGLYNNPYTAVIKKLEDYIENNISESRKKHIYGTKEEAVKLAERYNADVNKAAIAALLHDTTKELDEKTHLDIIEKYNPAVYGNEKEVYKLLHQITGAVYAVEKFGVDDCDVVNAVRYHTTGRAGMSLLEKIIFIADFIEPTRDYEGVEKIRKYAYDDLDATCYIALDFTIKTLEAEGKMVNRQTIEAYNYYADGSFIQ